MKDELQKALCDLKNNIIEMAKENEELRYCVDAQQDTIAAANQLIAKLKAEIELLTATRSRPRFNGGRHNALIAKGR